MKYICAYVWNKKRPYHSMGMNKYILKVHLSFTRDDQLQLIVFLMTSSWCFFLMNLFLSWFALIFWIPKFRYVSQHFDLLLIREIPLVKKKPCVHNLLCRLCVVFCMIFDVLLCYEWVSCTTKTWALTWLNIEASRWLK